MIRLRTTAVATRPSSLAEAICGEDPCGQALAAQPLFEKLSASDKEEVERIVRKEFRAKAHTTSVEKIIKDVLRRFAQVFYNRRGFWLNEL
jgi:hypothetical protein